MALSKKKRFAVFNRDGFTCQYCGRRPPLVVLQCDHIYPVSKGGDDSFENLITSCSDCNSGKSDSVLYGYDSSAFYSFATDDCFIAFDHDREVW